MKGYSVMGSGGEPSDCAVPLCSEAGIHTLKESCQTSLLSLQVE